MPTHFCDRCGRGFPYPSNLKRHKERKTPCVRALALSERKTADMPCCIHCGDTFTHQSAMYRHTRHRCRALVAGATRPEEDLRTIVAELRDQVERLRATADEAALVTVHNTLNITVNAPVRIRTFGEEDWSAFRERIVEKVANMPPGSGKGTISLAIYECWANDSEMENWTIAVFNKSKKDMHVMREGGWAPVCADELIPQLVTIACNQLDKAQIGLHGSPYFEVFCNRLKDVFQAERLMQELGTMTLEGKKLALPHMEANAARMRARAGLKSSQPLPVEF